MTAWHATELPSIHLAIAARVADVTVADVEHDLNETRALVKQLGLRRTLFAVGRDLLPAVIAGPGQRVAGPERRRLLKEVAAAGLSRDPEHWLANAEEGVLDALRDATLTTAEIKRQVPDVAGAVPVAIGTKWGQEVPLAPRVLTILAADGRVARAANATHWRTSRPAWTTMTRWLGAEPDLPDARTAYRDLVARWLRTFGPGSEDDIVWWLGATKTAVRAALADLGAVPVALAGGVLGWLLPDDLDPVEEPGEWAALVPALAPRRWAGAVAALTSIRPAGRICSTASEMPPRQSGSTATSPAPGCRTRRTASRSGGASRSAGGCVGALPRQSRGSRPSWRASGSP